MSNKINSPLPIVSIAGKPVVRVPLDQALNNIESTMPKHQGFNPQIPSPERKVVDLPLTPKQG